MTKYLIAFTAIITLLLSCKTARTEEAFQEAQYFNSKISNFKTAANTRFNFRFDIPNTWHAIDKSSNGDGYYLITGNEDVDVRIYACFNLDSGDDPVELIGDNAPQILNIKFDDGRHGKKIVKGNEVHFVRIDGDVKITLYIQSPVDWYQNNEDAIEMIAKSIRTGNS